MAISEMRFIRNKAISLIVVREFIKNNVHDSIDKSTDSCLKQQSSNVCYAKAEQDWDVKLNEQYKVLYSDIKEEDDYIASVTAESFKDKLKKSQRGWIHYRDSYNKFLHDYYRMPDNRFSDMETKSRVRIVQHKVVALQDERSALHLYCGGC